jgi:hypothetical protein
MAASEKDKQYWRNLARASEELEKETDRGTPEQRAVLLAWVNKLREQIGMPPLVDEDDDPPELEFYRIARARGLLRRPHRGS